MELTVPCGGQTCHKSDNPEWAGPDWGPRGAAQGGGLAQLEVQESFLEEEASELRLQMQIGVCPPCFGLSRVSLWSVSGALGGKSQKTRPQVA